MACDARLAGRADNLRRGARMALKRPSIGARSLDVLLGNKGEVDVEIADYARGKAAAFGVALESVGVKDLILPGEMKDILNQVVQAEKAAQANVIKRREETAATRSLLNTAKIMEESPVLMRLKELETRGTLAGESWGRVRSRKPRSLGARRRAVLVARPSRATTRARLPARTLRGDAVRACSVVARRFRAVGTLRVARLAAGPHSVAAPPRLTCKSPGRSPRRSTS